MKKLIHHAVLAVCALSPLLSPAQTVYNSSAFLDINNIKANHLVHGDMWTDAITQNRSCEFPKGSGHFISGAASLWMGGYDPQGNLRFAGQTYRSAGIDFSPGPLDSNGETDTATVRKWARIWKINRTTLDSFKNLSTHTIANTPADILEWPAKGNIHAKGYNGATLVINDEMAPFADVNNDGVYNALDGDFPDMMGDQTLWWIYNDNGGLHSGSFSDPLGMEISVRAYAYNRPGYAQNMLFYEYILKHKKNFSLDSFTVGMNADLDIGSPFDDYAGFDFPHRMGILYNGHSIDGTGQPGDYGNRIPIVGITMITLPGDSIQTYPAGSFMAYNNDNSNMGNPTGGSDMYHYLNASYKDGTHLKNPYTQNNAQYFAPDNPGLAGGWSECALNNIPGDRRVVVSSKPFNLSAAAPQMRIVMALIAQNPDTLNACPNTDFTIIKAMADTAWELYHTAPIPASVFTPNISARTLKVYPNPTSGTVFVATPGYTKDAMILVYDALGRQIQLPVNWKNDVAEINTGTLPNGIYTVQYRNGQQVSANVLVKQ